VRTWILGIVHNRAIDALRRATVHDRRRASDEGIDTRFVADVSALDHDDLLATAGAWVLGALPDDEARRFAEHLRECEACQREVARLQTVVDVLPLAAPPAEPPPGLEARITDVVEREAGLLAAGRQRADGPAARRSWWAGLLARPWIAAAGAAALLAVGVLAGVLVSGGSEPTARPITAVVGGPAARVTGTLVQRDGEAALRLAHMPAPPAGRVYQVWVMRGSQPKPDAVFTVDRSGRGEVMLRQDPRGARAVLVTDEPAGGSRVPTTKPSISVTPG
jgi:anti-sigma-K factor RskA